MLKLFKHTIERYKNIEKSNKSGKEISNEKINHYEPLFVENYKSCNKLEEFAYESEEFTQQKAAIVMANHNEEELLNYIIGVHFQEVKNTAKHVNGKNTITLAKTYLETGLVNMNFHNKKMNVEGRKANVTTAYNAEDMKSLVDNFVMNVNNISYVFGQIVRTANSIFEVGKTIFNANEKAQIELYKEKRYKIQADSLLRELIQMTVDETKICFEKATHVYLARYYATYYHDDVSYKNGKRTFSLIENYEELFFFQSLLSAKIDIERQMLVNLQIDNNIPCSYYSYKDYLHYIRGKDYLSYVKENKRNEFAIRHKLYRAYLKLGEFDVIDKCGDRNELSNLLACSALVYIFGLGVFTGIGLYISKFKKELKWSQNVLSLKEVMKQHLIVDTKYDFIVEKLYILEKLKYYIDLTKSDYAKDLLNKNLEEISYLFKNVHSKKLFFKCFDLYQKKTHSGIADRENYIHLNIDYVEKELVFENEGAKTSEKYLQPFPQAIEDFF